MNPVETFRGYPVRKQRFVIGTEEIVLLGPANHDELIDDPRVAERFEQNEFMPYWAQVWPAALLLADEIARWDRVMDLPPSQRPTVLELGCGLGLASLLAARRGYRVVASDYDSDALAFLRESAKRNAIPTLRTRALDWNKTHAQLSFDRIIASDVTYETRNLRPIAAFIHNHLTPDGFAVIADWNRTTADAFDSIARHSGLDVREEPRERSGILDSDEPIRGRLFRLRRKG